MVMTTAEHHTDQADTMTAPEQLAGEPAHVAPAGVCLHHAAIFVDDLERSVAFYTDLFGMEVTERGRFPEPPIDMVFLSSGVRHHDLVISRRLDRKTVPADKHELFHLAFDLPQERPFAEFLAEIERKQVTVAGGPFVHPVNRDGSGTRTAVYIQDPDGFLVEVTQDQAI